MRRNAHGLMISCGLTQGEESLVLTLLNCIMLLIGQFDKKVPVFMTTSEF
jgi:hypothetical protein